MIDPAPASSPAADQTVQPHRPPLDERRGAYGVRFAADPSDVEACCRMRFGVFNLELGEGLDQSEESGIDADPFDEQCNHLMVVENETGAVVGTYRMQTVEMARAGAGFYSAGEFDLSGIPEHLIEAGIELGRACIVKQHRNKVVLFMLWRGLMAYLLWNRKRYLFGCSSLTSQDPHEGQWAFENLQRKGHVRAEWFCPTLPAYTCQAEGYRSNPAAYPFPKLFATYLRHGASICSPPALDRFFGTIDFLTLLDKEKFDRRLAAVFALGLERR